MDNEYLVSVITLFMTWCIVFGISYVIATEGIKSIIQKGFTNDKKGFYTRFLIALLCLVVMEAAARKSWLYFLIIF